MVLQLQGLWCLSSVFSIESKAVISIATAATPRHSYRSVLQSRESVKHCANPQACSVSPDLNTHPQECSPHSRPSSLLRDKCLKCQYIVQYDPCCHNATKSDELYRLSCELPKRAIILLCLMPQPEIQRSVASYWRSVT